MLMDTRDVLSHGDGRHARTEALPHDLKLRLAEAPHLTRGDDSWEF